jgi:hypothetical protein
MRGGSDHFCYACFEKQRVSCFLNPLRWNKQDWGQRKLRSVEGQIALGRRGDGGMKEAERLPRHFLWRMKHVASSVTHIPAAPGLYVVGHEESLVGLELKRVPFRSETILD